MKKRMKAITHPSNFSEKVYNDIIRDFPEDAILKERICYVTEDYYFYCKKYVLENCKLPKYNGRYERHLNMATIKFEKEKK